MSTDTPEAYSLDCPDCSCSVFVREVNEFTDGEDEHCPECGSLVMVSADSESLGVMVVEHGGAVVARLRAEVERLTSDAKQNRAYVDKATEDAMGATQLAMDSRATIERLTAQLEALDLQDEVERLEATDREELHPKCLARGECERAYSGPMPGCSGRCLKLYPDETPREKDRGAHAKAEVERLTAQLEAIRVRVMGDSPCSNLAPYVSGAIDGLQDEAERLAGDLADERGAHAKTADNFEVAAEGWGEERERLTRERDEARRMYCEGTRTLSSTPAQQVAVAHGWDGLYPDETPRAAFTKGKRTVAEAADEGREAGRAEVAKSVALARGEQP